MKKINLLVVALLLVVSNLLAQNYSVNIKNVDESESKPKIYPMYAHEWLPEFNRKNGIIDSQIFQEMKALKKVTTPAWNFAVGSTKSWWALNNDPNSGDNGKFYQVPATCRAVGDNCYIFVEDALWGGRVNQLGVDGVRQAFDVRTPVSSSKGIFANNTEIFGNPPNVDGDNKIIILILDIIDGYSGTGGYIAGYFHSVNQSTTHQNSNKAEMFYLDGNPLDLSTPEGIAGGMSIIAHEFQHMIHSNYDADEEIFFNESMSMVAEVVNGYPLRNQTNSSGFNNETNMYLLNWRTSDNTNVLKDYSRAARYSLYMYEQFGSQILKNIVQTSLNGINGLTTALSNQSPSTSRSFVSTLEDWFVANYLNDKNTDSRFGYSNTRATRVNPRVHSDGNVANYDDQVAKFGAQYITYNNGTNLKFTYNNKGNSAVKVKAIKIGSGGNAVENLTSGVTYSVPDFGSKYGEVTFLVYVSDQNVFLQDPGVNKLAFSYNSSVTITTPVGPQEIAFDKTEPVGVYVFSVGDTTAVVFDGVSGMRLDSIRVALRNKVEIEGGIFTAVTTAPLKTGRRLAGPFKVAGKTIPGVVNPNPYIYPSPYPNWITVDLRSSNIDAGTSFAAAFVIDGAYVSSASPTNRVMHTSVVGSTSQHSWTYLNNPGSETSPPGWYYIVDSEAGTVSLYLIRAYVSSKTSDVNEEYELIPGTYSLDQNYPNPFNPETAISYQLTKSEYVSLKIYDSLGRLVRVLIDGEKGAGKYKTNWNGTDETGNFVTSGIYFYTINAGEFSQTKKMILMK